MRTTEDRYERALQFDDLPSGRSRFVSASFKKLDDALDASRDLEKHGFTRERISLFMSTDTREHYIDAHPRYGELEDNAVTVEEVDLEKRSRVPEGTGVGGVIGGAVGAAGAAIAAVGTSLVIPALGIVVAGPVAAGLAGLGAGATAGGLVGALVGAGMSEYRAADFQRLMKEGRIILGVAADTEPERLGILEILERHGGDTVPEHEERA